tara:strand:+ start:882 stop:1067 length:186 start_codon:yes stop_codon:yes gene_type:complete
MLDWPARMKTLSGLLPCWAKSPVVGRMRVRRVMISEDGMRRMDVIRDRCVEMEGALRRSAM